MKIGRFTLWHYSGEGGGYWLSIDSESGKRITEKELEAALVPLWDARDIQEIPVDD